MRSAFAIALLSVGTHVQADGPAEGETRPVDLQETPDDPPARGPLPRDDVLARSAGGRVVEGPYESVQVNVDGNGMNIVGDAANEPSIAVDPGDPSSLVIGWRQFDTIASNFRQAGIAVSTDGGNTWGGRSPLTPGVFRSDPVLAFDADGNVFYQSLAVPSGSIVLDVFESADGGLNWSDPVPSFGGDKNWLDIDRTDGIGRNNIYGIWQRFSGCCGLNTLTRSTDGGTSYETPTLVDLWPTFGTIAVGPDGEVYASGIRGVAGQEFDTFVVSRSDNAQDPFETPIFVGTVVPLGGSMAFGGPPNPGGLLGQANVAVDPSTGPTRGNVYLLASVDTFPPFSGPDPMDVHFARSSDGGQTWSAPVRVNDDPPGAGNWHWFGAMSVAPNGRIDAIWNDTRNSRETLTSQLFYAYSWDEGRTWSTNVAVSPPFDSLVGHPNQSKLGDYYQLISNADGADVAYAATFNGEQDVWYVNVYPDCNENGTSDVVDIRRGPSPDCNDNHIPDECEAVKSCTVSGAVPDGRLVEGKPLRVEPSKPGSLELSWGASCLAGDGDFEIYVGELGMFDTYSSAICSTGGFVRQRVPNPEGSAFYLVVPTNGTTEGSYGRDGSGAERPPAGPATRCRPQELGVCPTR